MTTSLRCHDVNDDDDDYYLFNCVFIYLFILLYIYILHLSMGNSPKMAEDARLVNYQNLST